MNTVEQVDYLLGRLVEVPADSLVVRSKVREGRAVVSQSAFVAGVSQLSDDGIVELLSQVAAEFSARAKEVHDERDAWDGEKAVASELNRLGHVIRFLAKAQDRILEPLT